MKFKSKYNRITRQHAVIATFLSLAAAALLACDSGPREPPAGASPPPPAAPAKTSDGAAKSRLPGAPRIVAIGDVHGDLAATRAALRLAGAIDESDRWSGGSLVVVQVGDQLDRGDSERAILDLFDRLTDDAKKAGGAFHVLNGNHEIMNVAFDFRYVTEAGFHDFEGLSGMPLSDPRLTELPPRARARAAAFLPGAPYAKLLAKRDVALILGDTVFVHGGLLPQHVRYGLDRMNAETKAWMSGEAKSPPNIVMGDDAPIWTRIYSGESTSAKQCETLKQTLDALSVKRLVVGHTVQKSGITSACDGKVWRIDVGLAAYYGGNVEVLEIAGGDVRPLKKSEGAAAPTSASAGSAAPH
ncbi:MAG: metallophosphoesterase [Polyangiaceae bacterium]|nr:metallophosphoesterase [Polyangiaceae bacterium]